LPFLLDGEIGMDFKGKALAMSQTGIGDALNKTGASGPGLWSVLSTETSGCGFQSNGRPKILFERHVFHRLTDGKFDSQDPDVSAPTAGGYGASGDHQYTRLQAAMLLDKDAALKSASWGLGQIMGFNFKAAGFGDVDDMIAAFANSEDAQLGGMVAFMATSGMTASLATKSWAHFARLYNGPNYAQNDYDGKLQHFCGIYEARGVPDVMLRAAQMYLTFLGYTVGGIDGIEGQVTDAAIRKFCAAAPSHPQPVVGQALVDALRAAVDAKG
jgi:hypothetical protein